MNRNPPGEIMEDQRDMVVLRNRFTVDRRVRITPFLPCLEVREGARRPLSITARADRARRASVMPFRPHATVKAGLFR
jgi:hypothetical protein